MAGLGRKLTLGERRVRAENGRYLAAQREEDAADPWIGEGAGTIALEAGEQAGPSDLVLAPMGSGALAGRPGADGLRRGIV